LAFGLKDVTVAVMAVIAVEVWIWSLAMPATDVLRLEQLLSSDERQRAKRFVSPRHGDSYIAGRGRMREILARRVGCLPDELRFAYGRADKPELQGIADAPHFNLSHSGGFAALAVADRPVGIDIEAVRPITDDIAGRFFSPAEVHALRNLPSSEQTAAFFRCWTRKEAFVKALGAGLNYPLSSFDVSVTDDPYPRVLRADMETETDVACWRLVNFVPGPEITGAIALKADTATASVEVLFHT
jgi:4'-phosphopantetheinyl transferase